MTARASGRIDREWLPETVFALGETESLGKDADDRRRSAVDHQRLTDRIAAGEARPGEVVTKDQRRRRARLHVRGREWTAARDRDAEDVEHVFGDPRAFDLLRHIAADGGARGHERAKRRQSLLAGAMIDEVELAPRELVAVALGILRIGKDDAIEILSRPAADRAARR